MKKMMLNMIKGYVLEILEEKVLNKLRAKARQSPDNKVDDEAVKYVEQYIYEAFK